LTRIIALALLSSLTACASLTDRYAGVTDKARYGDDLAICRARSQADVPAPSTIGFAALFGAPGGAAAGVTMGPVYVKRAQVRGQCMADMGYQGVSR
jgi:hypothetical protein